MNSKLRKDINKKLRELSIIEASRRLTLDYYRQREREIEKEIKDLKREESE